MILHFPVAPPALNARRGCSILALTFLALPFALSVFPTSAQDDLPPPPEASVPPLSEMLGGGQDDVDPPAPEPLATPEPLDAPPPIEPLEPAESSGASPQPEFGSAPPPETTSDATGVPAPIEPPIIPAIPAPPDDNETRQIRPAATPSTLPSPTLPPLGDTGGGAQAREFSGDDVATVLRLLARQARINLVVSESVVGTVTMRLENVTAFEAIRIIANSKGFFIDEVDNVFYVKTAAEKAAEPQEPGDFRFSYARATDIAPLLQKQLVSKAEPIVDSRTNTIFYREVVSNLDPIKEFLKSVDSPTRQVMIEARLVEVAANPRQDYGIDWSGVLFNRTIGLRGSDLLDTRSRLTQRDSLNARGGSVNELFITPGGASGTITLEEGSIPDVEVSGGPLDPNGTTGTVDFGGSSSGNSVFDTFNSTRTVANSVLTSLGGFALNPSNLFNTIGGQFAILDVPSFGATLNLLNQDQDTEFIAHPRIVTLDNQEATIKIVREDPVPQLTFNAETATSEFSGFQTFEYGSTLVVRPTVNKDNYITLSVRPEISTTPGDQTYVLSGGSVVRAPIIDTRSLESNVLIQSGDTLAIGGLLQDETRKARTKVPVLGDLPLLGYLFQSRSNIREKRNLLVFVTPTALDLGQPTGLEDQVNTGLSQSAEEYADPDGWLNNARGSVRLVPPRSAKPLTSRYPIPGEPRRISAPGAP